MDRLLEATARAEREHFWFRGFRRFVAPMLERAAGGGSNLSLLDCGCGTGINLPLLRRHGRAFGVDLTWTGLAFAHARGDRSVAQASASSLPFPTGSFDVVASFDVIYALSDTDEAAALDEMHRVLKGGGKLVITVAAMDFLKGNHSVLAAEVRRYSRRSLTERLNRHGFAIERITYTNASILPLLTAVRLAQRASGHEESNQEIEIPARPLNAMLSALLAAEAAALRVIDMPFGSSLMALARRRD